MSVPKGKRGTSKFEVLNHAFRMRKDFTLLLLRDFGFRKRIKNYTANFDEEDKALFETLNEKYSLKTEYPEWLVNHFRETIIKHLNSLIDNIVKANTIYITNENEFIERRKYQTQAISDCECLFQDLQYIISIIDTDINKYAPFIEMVDKEIFLLKAWRKNGNKVKYK